MLRPVKFGTIKTRGWTRIISELFAVVKVSSYACAWSFIKVKTIYLSVEKQQIAFNENESARALTLNINLSCLSLLLRLISFCVFNVLGPLQDGNVTGRYESG